MPWALAKGPHEGLRPASMWQWPVPDELLKKGLRTNSAGAKKSPCAVPDFVYEGVPCYDEKRYYTGPLPSAANLGFMFQRNAKGPFKTSGSEKWPATGGLLPAPRGKGARYPTPSPATGARRGWPAQGVRTKAIMMEVVSARLGAGPTLPEAMRDWLSTRMRELILAKVGSERYWRGGSRPGLPPHVRRRGHPWEFENRYPTSSRSS